VAPLLRIADVHTYYGDSHVLQGLTLEVEQGSVCAVLGRNGVGKTTLCRSIVGFTPARSGTIVFAGADITTVPPHRIHQRRLGLVPQGRRVFPSLTVDEHLAIACRSPEPLSWNAGNRLPIPIRRVFELFPRLEERRHHRGNELSGGEQQMLAIGRALVAEPILLVMDEPTEGLSIAASAIVADAVGRLRENGTTVLLAEQNAAFAVKLADCVHVMAQGRIVHSSSAAELWQDEDIKGQYLGVPRRSGPEKLTSTTSDGKIGLKP
jgi:branched-chain amino acid transport system ATP-binding protein